MGLTYNARGIWAFLVCPRLQLGIGWAAHLDFPRPRDGARDLDPRANPHVIGPRRGPRRWKLTDEDQSMWWRLRPCAARKDWMIYALRCTRG